MCWRGCGQIPGILHIARALRDDFDSLWAIISCIVVVDIIDIVRIVVVGVVNCFDCGRANTQPHRGHNSIMYWLWSGGCGVVHVDVGDGWYFF